jgi:acetyl esterase/lipase
VLLIHGGGWAHGSRLDGDHQCEAFLRHGLVAVPVDYRLAGSGPDTYWPAQIQDVQLAMRWVRANAGTLGIDPRHICALGSSAGGHLALMLGTVRGIEPGDMASVLPSVSPQADCVISIAGPTDLHALAQVRPNLVNTLIGPVDPATQATEEAGGSPALLVQRGAAPTLLIQGTNDEMVPYAQATEMQDALTRAGVPVWLISHAGSHAMKGISKPEDRGIWKAIFTFLTSESLQAQPHSLTANDIAIP